MGCSRVKPPGPRPPQARLFVRPVGALPLILAHGLSKLVFSPQHQGTARGLRASMVSTIAKVSDAGKIPEGYKLKG
jgi:hypothetical protein